MEQPTGEDTPRAPRARRWLGLAGWAALVAAVAWLGSRFSADTAWFRTLEKPSWNPPGAVFGPVWTALYALMAVAAWRVWRRAGWGGARDALALFLVQLALNGAWSWIFFGLQRPGPAFAEIVLLWAAVGATLTAFARYDRVAGWLMIPYFLWVTFAAALNFAIWRMNA